MRTGVRPRGPDFLGIGAQRAGTTWMHRFLRGHPDLWLSPIKELHYFNDPSNKRWFRNLRTRLAQGPGRWDVSYFLGARDDDWYARLFSAAQASGKLAGEITPSYAVLDNAVLQRIHAINPEVKLIFSMREPIARAWSSWRNRLKKKPREGAGPQPNSS